jgi:hypothetical protein
MVVVRCNITCPVPKITRDQIQSNFFARPGTRLPANAQSHSACGRVGLRWNGFPDWLGTGNVKCGDKEWRPFPEAWTFARSLGLSSQKKWNLLTYPPLQIRPTRIRVGISRNVRASVCRYIGRRLRTISDARFYIERVRGSLAEAQSLLTERQINSHTQWPAYHAQRGAGATV